MNHLRFSAEELSTYPIVFLVPQIDGREIRKHYLEPFGIDPDEVMVLDLWLRSGKAKTPKTEMKAYIEQELVPVLSDFETEYLVVSDGEYFKTLTGAPKVDPAVGYVLGCQFGPWKVVYVPNHKTIWYNPEQVGAKISAGLTALVDHRNGAYIPPGTEVIKKAYYPKTDIAIEEWLARILEMECPVTIDIEAFSLKHDTAGIATITICWNKHEGIAFPVDYVEEEWDETVIDEKTGKPKTVHLYGRREHNEYRREMLRAFFEQLSHKAIYHNIAFDAYVLIYQLYMKSIIDTAGLLKGIEILLRDWDCTKLISYLATNSCAGNKLSLKDQSQEYAGNYAMGESIKDIRRIPLDKLLRYNLVDGLSTWFVHEKHYDTMVADQQLEIYETLFKPSTVDIIQMQLTGLPVNMQRVKEVKAILKSEETKAVSALRGSVIIQDYEKLLRLKAAEKANAKYKKKRVTSADFVGKVEFNPRSGPQVQALLYEHLGYPIIERTKSGGPSTKAKTVLQVFFDLEQDPDKKHMLGKLLDYSSVAIILSTFIPALENSSLGPDGWHYLFGNFNLGGTLSGRLSSSDPNLQNLPANSKWAKYIKSCIEAPPGWIFAGLDFASLEDRISALTTKDPAKLRVYTDGYDGHALRTFWYFREQLNGIVDTVESINSIAEKSSPYYHLRQKSKAPSFALTYRGTFKTLMKNCGFTEAVARQIEDRFNDLYKVSIDWVSAKLDQAARDGYVTVAFGLRVRTPLLKQVIRGTSKTPHEAEAEGRSAGNALGQSWCLLNSRAGNEFMGKVRASNHRLDIRPCAQIHDAQYYLVREDLVVLGYMNVHLVQAVNWQDHPDIYHPDVGLGGEVSVFWPTWAEEIVIPNDANDNGDAIQAAIDRELAKREEKNRKAA